MQFVRVPLAAAVAALTLTGCNLQKDCCCTKTEAKAPAEAGKPAAGATGASKTTKTVATRKTTTKAHGPAGRGKRVEGGYRYASTGSGYVAAGGRYVGSSVSVSETETSSSGYRYSSSEERYGSRGGAVVYGSSSGGGYAYGSGSASGGVYAPPPAAGIPAHHPGYTLASTDRNGYLTWPGKVQ